MGDQKCSYVLIMKTTRLIQTALLLTMTVQAQDSASRQSQVSTLPSQEQIQSCLAKLPKKPKPPAPQVNLFPALQARIDAQIRKIGGDPNAMRQAAAQAAQEKYKEKLEEYQRKLAACYGATPVPPAIPAAQEKPKQ